MSVAWRWADGHGGSRVESDRDGGGVDEGEAKECGEFVGSEGEAKEAGKGEAKQKRRRRPRTEADDQTVGLRSD